MNRLIMLIAVAVMVFAASGIHRFTPVESVDQTTVKSQSQVVVLDLVQNATGTDCCAETSLNKHSPHDHCNTTCAILPNSNRAEREWSIGAISEFRTDTLDDNPLDLMKRPPRILV